MTLESDILIQTNTIRSVAPNNKKIVRAANSIDALVHAAATPGPVPPPGGSGGALTPSGPIKLAANQPPIRNKAIVADPPRIVNGSIIGGIGIEGGSDVTGPCDVADSTIKGVEYGIILSHGTRLHVARTPIEVIGGIDNCYGIRAWMERETIIIEGDPNNRPVIDNGPGFKALLRLSNYAAEQGMALEIRHVTLVGSGSWLGTGAKEQNLSMPVCGPAWIHDFYYYLIAGDKKHAFELYENCQNHTFERGDFYLLDGSNYDCFGAWSDKPGCFGHQAKSCRVGTCNASRNATSTLRPLGWQDFDGGQAKHGAKWSIQ